MRNGKSRASRALGSTSNVSRTAPKWRFLGLAVGRETSNVCVQPEKERERMKCSLADIEGLSAQIGNLGNLGPEELDQTWRALFGSERPRRVRGNLLIKALGYPPRPGFRLIRRNVREMKDWMVERDELERSDGLVSGL